MVDFKAQTVASPKYDIMMSNLCYRHIHLLTLCSALQQLAYFNRTLKNDVIAKIWIKISSVRFNNKVFTIKDI